MASLEGWSDTMYALAMCTKPEQQPSPWPDSKPYMRIFGIIFIVIGSFLLINLITSESLHPLRE